MKTIQLDENRGNTNYLEYLKSIFGGTISGNTLNIDDELGSGIITILEGEDYRIVDFYFTPKVDQVHYFNRDTNFEITLSFFLHDVHYKSQGKDLVINVPNGFVMLQNDAKIQVQFKKDVPNHLITLYVKKQVLNDYAIQKLNEMDDFIYHIGDVSLMSWKNSYTKRLIENLEPKFRLEWVNLKLLELGVIAKNIVYQISENIKVENLLFSSH